MSKVKIKEISTLFREKAALAQIEFGKEDYLLRLELLQKRLTVLGLTHAVIYGDREHFANIEYFSGYDCRFEESLLIVPAEGTPFVVVGNEGYSYSFQIPYEIHRLFYQHFSLQGQPRESSPAHLKEIFEQAGIGPDASVGAVGYKYFYEKHCADPEHTYDIPAYIMDELKASCGEIRNITKELTGLPDGIRMKVRTPKEVAYMEYNACKCADVLLNLLDGLEPDLDEQELSRRGKADFSPVCMFGLVNFGDKHLSLGLRSPNEKKLAVGEVCGLCYGVRGSLCARTGVAAYNEDDYPDDLRPNLALFYKPAWEAIVAWYESMKEGALSGDVYEAVMSRIGGPTFGISLNPGHNIGMDEWVNSSFYKDSVLPIVSGGGYQSDIIPNSSSPVMSAICEDTVVIADAEFRAQIEKEYPEMYSRIRNRQEFMRSVLGIKVDDSLLPMSPLNGVYFPFMLDTTKVFSK